MSAALDLTRPRRLNHTRQDVARPSSAPTPSGSRPAWCVVATYAKAERRAHAALHLFGFEAYLPLVTVRLPNRHYHTRALFPGYCFVRLDLTKPWSPVRYAPGVFQLLSFDGQPARCSDHALEAVRKAVDAAEAFSATEPPWKPGMPCSLTLGPLNGMPGVVLKVGHDMALVSLLMLGQLREVSVSLDCLTARDE